VIMTSNMGTREIKSGKAMGFQKDDLVSSFEQMKHKITDELKRTFNPELLNRIDEVIIFKPLGMEQIMQIIDILLKDVSKRLFEKGISFELTDKAKEFLAVKGYNPTFGARPLKRAIQKYLEDPLAEEILKGQFKRDCQVLVDRGGDDSLSFSIRVREEGEIKKSLKS
jgi:ATP-dependent Clp protease ATP-binding subunit ClpC